MTKNELYKKAIDTFGIYSQTLVFHEEMAEALEILKGISTGNLAEEIADALIMVEQMAFNFGVTIDIDLRPYKIVNRKKILKELETSYLQVNQLMSHIIRKRATGCLFEHGINCLWAMLMLTAVYANLEDSKLEEFKEQKLHRLAGMLGVEYDGRGE